MRDDRKIASMLGLAQRAGKLHSGADQVEAAIKRGKAQLVIIATDASDNAKKEYTDSCSFYQVPLLEWGVKESLGHAIGKPMRTVVAVLDQGFADRLKELLLGEVGTD